MDTELINARVVNLLKQKFRISQSISPQNIQQYSGSPDRLLSMNNNSGGGKEKSVTVEPIQYQYQVNCVELKGGQVSLFFQ